MKKILISVTCVSAIALSLFVVSCTKKEVAQPTAVATTNNQISTTNARVAIPVKPDVLPDPNQFLYGGGECCLHVSYKENSIHYSEMGESCDAEWGMICGWTCLLCSEGSLDAYAKISLPNLDKVTTGIIYVKFQYTGKLDKAGKPMTAADDLLMGDVFNKLAKCDAAYLLKGDYTIQKGNVATMAVYVVNHKI